MPICDQCSSSIQRLHLQGLGNRREDRDIKVTLPVFRHANVFGCWICSKFSQWLETEDPNLFKRWSRQFLPLVICAYGRCYVAEPQEKIVLPMFMSIMPEHYDKDGPSCDVELNFIPTKDYVSPIEPVLNRHGTAGIDFTTAKGWIETCTRHHQKCRDNDEVWYPSRMLHLDREGRKAKLVISENVCPEGRYMTLSHRWGKQSFTTLNSSTISQLQKTVCISGLPQVFQDAIKLASHLGIYYLWIDALCIKQEGPDDNHSDWKDEAQHMNKIYSNAFLNVSATMSFDGSESLFQRRCWGPILPAEINIEIDGMLQKYYVLDGDIWHDEIDNAALNKRGWVFQERFLARRVLHFGRRQMGWECRQLDALEVCPRGLPRVSVYSLMTKSRLYHELATTAGKSDETVDEAFAETWQGLVTRYSNCKLTFAQDKLIAFSGVAKSLSISRTDRYVAGMWQNTLIYDLAWFRWREDRAIFPISETISRAPSWSWASVDGEVHFPSLLGGTRAKLADIQGFSGSTVNDSGILVELASIRVSGACLPLNMKLSNGEITSFEVAGFHFTVEDGSKGSEIDIEGSEQEVQDLVRQSKVLLLPLFATSYFLHGILITKIRGVGAHRRIGAIHIAVRSESISHAADQAAETARPKFDTWVEGEESSGLEGAKVSWNESAVELMHYMIKPQRVRTVHIF